MNTSKTELDIAARHTLMRIFLEAIALGELALGATTEFLSVPAAVERTLALKDKGYPFKPAGGGWLNLLPGAHTDDTDMALAIAKAFVASGDTFDSAATVKQWHEWLSSRPPDVGMLTRQALYQRGSRGGVYDLSRDLFLQSPQRAPNGALMRNAIVCAMAPDLRTAFEWSLKQGILTHYHPQSVLCCAVQVWLIWETFEQRWPFEAHEDWLHAWHKAWTNWISKSSDIDIATWRATVEKDDQLNTAMETLCGAEFDPDVFDPFRDVTAASQGWVLASLQVGVWAMQWCRRSASEFTFHSDFVPSPTRDLFERRGHDLIGWIPLIGRDADTYGAIAGPMIAAAMGKPFPSTMIKSLAIRDLLRFLDD